MDFIYTLQNEIVSELGSRRAAHVNVAVLPSIIMDFRKMILDADDGQVVIEDYNLEDGSLSLSFKGQKQGDSPQITEIKINGRQVDL